jgi:hypothetical protein
MGDMQIDSKTALIENRLVQYTDPVKMTYADGATTVAAATRRLICWLPAKSVVTNVLVRKVTNFNAATNDYLTVGSYSDDDLLVDDLDVSTAAALLPVDMAKGASLVPAYFADETAIYATYVYSSTAPTTGELEVAIEWVPWHIRDLDVTKVG